MIHLNINMSSLISFRWLILLTPAKNSPFIFIKCRDIILLFNYITYRHLISSPWIYYKRTEQGCVISHIRRSEMLLISLVWQLLFPIQSYSEIVRGPSVWIRSAHQAEIKVIVSAIAITEPFRAVFRHALWKIVLTLGARLISSTRRFSVAVCSASNRTNQ